MAKFLKDVYQPEQCMGTDEPLVLDHEAIRAECADMIMRSGSRSIHKIPGDYYVEVCIVLERGKIQ